MTSSLLEKLRAGFAQNENQNTNSRPSNYYRFYDMQDEQSCTVRFLPDKNGDNPLLFLVEKLTHNLEINGERKVVPCLKMYDEECPICNVSRQYYKEGDEATGKKYYRKKQHLGQVLVVDDPLPADSETGENSEGKVRLINVGWQIFNILKDSLSSGELDEVPFAYEGGTDFIIKKTTQGKYAAYSVGTKFARKSTDLTEDEIAYVQEELVDLSTLLPANPGRDKVDALLEAALTGKALDDSSSSDDDDDDDAPRTTRAASKPARETPPAKFSDADEDDDDDEFDGEADKILAQIRNRQKSKAE